MDIIITVVYNLLALMALAAIFFQKGCGVNLGLSFTKPSDDFKSDNNLFRIISMIFVCFLCFNLALNAISYSPVITIEKTLSIEQDNNDLPL
ncbi:hypothetical protein GNP64_02750 [Aliivibrio fischeri]|uniref:hypothetical protein n=1 Tax=Aliivibrio fischeri TaxID=668 RepID=UPI0012DA99F9|nr:hypothetical protein [Aliivibrio fischeri]MUL04953.1 hypothetical protein [Aliivibrio fischeri]